MKAYVLGDQTVLMEGIDLNRNVFFHAVYDAGEEEATFKIYPLINKFGHYYYAPSEYIFINYVAKDLFDAMQYLETLSRITKVISKDEGSKKDIYVDDEKRCSLDYKTYILFYEGKEEFKEDIDKLKLKQCRCDDII